VVSFLFVSVDKIRILLFYFCNLNRSIWLRLDRPKFICGKKRHRFGLLWQQKNNRKPRFWQRKRRKHRIFAS